MSLTLLFIISLIELSSSLHSIECDFQTHPCNSSISCNPDDDCRITCKDEGCIRSDIYCPTKGDCIIMCSGSKACWGAKVHAENSNGNFDLWCQSSLVKNAYTNDNLCRDITIYGSTLPSSQNSGDHFNVICGNDRLACHSAQINCAHATDCQISCNSTVATSCMYARINGPISHQLSVECDGPTSCENTKIVATQSSSLSITGCTQTGSCNDLSLHCPQRSDTKNCHLQGNDNLQGSTQIYAVNGWNDIDIQYSGTYSNVGGAMHCGSDYSATCDIVSGAWSCGDNYMCGGTLSPTLMPTVKPSINPTMNPTMKPTVIPTASPVTPMPTTPGLQIKNTKKPTKYGEGGVNDETTSYIDQERDNTIIGSKNSNKTLLIILVCGVFGFIACSMLGFGCFYFKTGNTTDTQKHTKIARKHSKIQSKSSYSTGTVHTHAHLDYTIGSTEMAQIGEEERDRSVPMRLNSDEAVLDGSINVTIGKALQKHKGSLAPSYTSNICEIVESAHNDDEVLASDDEDTSNGPNVYKFNTPTGHKLTEDEIYTDRMADAVDSNNVQMDKSHKNDDIELPQFNKMQSEGGEHYHKMKLEGHKSSHNIVGQKCNVIIKIPINEDEEDDNCNTPIGNQITPFGDDNIDNILDFGKKIEKLNAVNENQSGIESNDSEQEIYTICDNENDVNENDINDDDLVYTIRPRNDTDFLNEVMSDDIIIGDDEVEMVKTPENDDENEIIIGNYVDIINVNEKRNDENYHE